MADLRQSTITVIKYGPFVDATDFVTLLDDLDSSGTNELIQSTIRLSKNGTIAGDSNATSILSDGNGSYLVTLPVSAVDTRGVIDLNTKLASSLVVEDRYTVLSQAVYDQKYGDKENATQENLDGFKTAFGTTKVKAIDGSDVDFVSMFIKALDDNNGDDFDATTDSLNKLRSVISTGGVQAKTADSDTIIIGSILSGSLPNTEVQDGVNYVVTPAGGGGGELEQTMDFICGPSRLGVKIDFYGWFGGGGNSSEYVSVSAYSWDDLIYKPISNNSNHIYKRTGAFQYAWTLDAEFSKSDTGLVRLKFDSSTNNSSRTFNIDYIAVDNLNVHETTPSDYAHAVWNYVSKNNNIAANTMGGYISTLTQGQYLISAVTDSQNFQVASTFTGNLYNGYPILVGNTLTREIENATIDTIDSSGNITLKSALSFTPTTSDVIQINFQSQLSSDNDIAQQTTLTTLATDLQITLNLGGTGATLQGNLKDIYDKAGTGGGGSGIAWTDPVNGETFQSVMDKLSARTTGRIFRVDNGNGTYTVTYYYSNNAEAFSKIVSENERLDA